MAKEMRMGWRAQEFYHEYLDLKVEISELALRLETAHIYLDNGKATREALDKKLERMKVVLWELNAGGVSAEKLLYLSMGVEVE